MKKPITLFAIALVATAFVSCTSSKKEVDLSGLEEILEEIKEPEQKYEVKEVDDKYSMEIPTFMTSTTMLNEDASLQYNALYKEKYIIAIDEDKGEFLEALDLLNDHNEDESVIDNYARIQMDFFREASTVLDESSIIKEKINGLDARIIAIDADVAGVPASISYWMGYIEGKDRLYTIMAWTLKNRKDDFEEEAHKMIRSLKEL